MNTPDERVFGERRAPVAPPAGGELRVVYHGGLADRFGVETLVRAVALLRERGEPVALDVYGSDAEAAAHLAAAASEVAPEGVRIAPQPTPVEEIPARLAEAHLGVVPTLRDDFTELLLPVKLLEYVHMGLPVGRLAAAGDRALLRRRRAARRAGRPGLDRRRDRSACAPIRAAARERAERASERLAQIEWRRQRRATWS